MFQLTARRALWSTLTCLLPVLACNSGCGAGSSFEQVPATQLQPRDMSSAELLQEIAALELPGLPESVAEALRTEFARQLAASSQTRWLSTPPRGINNNIGDLQLIEAGTGSRSLSWNYRNTGDYDLNGEANISDLGPLGMHLGKTSSAPDWESARRADGDGNGVVSIADLTPIGANLLGQVTAYRILGAATAEEPLAELAILPVSKELLSQSTALHFDLPEGLWLVFAVEPLDAAGASGARSNLCGAGISLKQFPGSPGSNLNAGLPQIEFPRSDQASLIETASGLPLLGNRIGVLFEAGATVADGNALLATLGAELIGSDPFTDAVLLQIPPAADTAAMASVLEQARGSAGVQLACCDMAGIGTPDTSEDYPTIDEHQGSSLRELPPARYTETYNEFGYTYPDVSYSACYTRWGIENVRAPQGWNLRTYGQRQGTPPEALVIDEFAKFQDDWYGDVDLRDGPGLVFKPVDPNRPPRPYDTHGSQVAEILGANWWNQKNFESVNPLQPTLDGVDLDMDGELIATLLNAFSYVFARGLAQNPRLVVVNNSWGLSKGWADVAMAEWMDPLGDLFNEGAARFEQDHRGNFLICSAAGYDGDASGTLIPYDSVFSNVAVRYPDGHYICCELIDDKDTYTGKISINLGGTVSAPGYQMPYSGTSFSTPMVSSLVSYVWALDPDLTWQQVRTLVTGAGYAVPTSGGSRPRIDAYNAVMGIDKVKGTRTMQRAMVDVDDGTPDGQTRINPFDGATVTEIATADGQRGDELATMRDFRAWRDAYLDVESTLSGKLLDGPALHFKRDLNFNGVIGSALASPPHAYPWTGSNLSPNPAEQVYSRYDFNGDGLIDLQPAPVNQVMMTDLEMLADAAIWQLPELDGYNEGVSAKADDEGQMVAGSMWRPARYLLANRDAGTNAPQALKDLPDYLHSCDLHIMIDWDAVPADVNEFELTLRSEISGDGLDNNGADGADEAFEVTFDRTATVTRSTAMPLLLTLPCWTGNLRLQWDDGADFAGTRNASGLRFGEDRAETIPGQEWHVTDFGVHGPLNENNDMNQKLTTVGGLPAIAGFRSFASGDYEQYFLLAKNAAATEWEEPVTIASLNDGDFEFASIDGRPAIAYVSANQIQYKAADDAAGTSWGANVPVWTGSTSDRVSRIRLAEVAGNPAFGFVVSIVGGTEEAPELIAQDIRYVRAQNPDGTAWPSEGLVSTANFIDFLSLIEVAGLPGLGTFDGNYFQGASPNGGFSQAVVSNQVITDLKVVDGNPAAVTGLGVFSHTYSRADDPLGSSWSTPQTLPVSSNVLCRLVIVGGHPMVVYQDGNALEYIRALDEQGTQWSQPVRTFERADQIWITGFAVANDNLCMVFQSAADRRLFFAIQR